MSFAGKRQIAASMSVLLIQGKHFLLALYFVCMFSGIRRWVLKKYVFQHIIEMLPIFTFLFLILPFARIVCVVEVCIVFNFTICQNCLCCRGTFSVCLLLLSCCLPIQFCHCCGQLTNLVELGRNIIRVQPLSAFLNFFSCIIKWLPGQYMIWVHISAIPSWAIKFCGDGYFKNIQLFIRLIS